MGGIQTRAQLEHNRSVYARRVRLRGTEAERTLSQRHEQLLAHRVLAGVSRQVQLVKARVCAGQRVHLGHVL